MGMAASYMTQTITVFRATSTDDWNVPTGTPTTAAARVEYGNRMIRTQTGEQVVSRALVLTEYAVAPGDIVTLPDGTSQAALDVRPIPGLSGTEDHREVYL